jgi:hypothetical protein
VVYASEITSKMTAIDKSSQSQQFRRVWEHEPDFRTVEDGVLS